MPQPIKLKRLTACNIDVKMQHSRKALHRHLRIQRKLPMFLVKYAQSPALSSRQQLHPCAFRKNACEMLDRRPVFMVSAMSLAFVLPAVRHAFFAAKSRKMRPR
jgi:hypothetical protein